MKYISPSHSVFQSIHSVVTDYSENTVVNFVTLGGLHLVFILQRVLVVITLFYSCENLDEHQGCIPPGQIYNTFTCDPSFAFNATR